MINAEKRRTPRVPCDLLVEWKRGDRTLHCRARDLNADGLFIATEVPVSLHYAMDMLVHLPTGPVDVLGVSRFAGRTRHGHGIGVSIHVIDRKDRERWMQFYRGQCQDFLATLPAGIARHLEAP